MIELFVLVLGFVMGAACVYVYLDDHLVRAEAQLRDARALADEAALDRGRARDERDSAAVLFDLAARRARLGSDLLERAVEIEQRARSDA